MQPGRKRHPLWRPDPAPAAPSHAGARPGLQPSSAAARPNGAAQQQQHISQQTPAQGARAAINPAQVQAGARAAGPGPQQLLQAGQQPQQAPQQTPELHELRRRRFLARVRLALLDSCHAAVLVFDQLRKEGRVRHHRTPQFPAEKLEEAYSARCVCY